MKTESKLSKSRRGKKSKISFDEEVVNKDQAEKLLSEQGIDSTIPKRQTLEKNSQPELKTKKMKKRKSLENNSKNSETSKPKKIRISNSEPIDSQTDTTEPPVDHTQEHETTRQPKKDSIRNQKRKKSAALLEKKKLKAELGLQQKALNYLSKWKHSRSEWKFEKLKQVWIQQNLFNASKIPDEFWETTVEYCSGAQGHSRQVALDEAIKIIENEEGSTEENLDEDKQVKVKRARSIVQNLQ